MNKTSRRDFIAKTMITTAAVATALPSEAAPKKEPFIHHVYFWLKNPNNAADTAKLIEGLTKLAKVPEIKMHYIGKPATTNRSVIERTYAVSWLCFFENLAEEEVYQTHPIHLKFIEEYSHLWEKVIVYDSVDAKISH
jgi:Stress responsive A/B Barrel Domain